MERMEEGHRGRERGDGGTAGGITGGIMEVKEKGMDL
jgi:hypothetical protein